MTSVVLLLLLLLPPAPVRVVGTSFHAPRASPAVVSPAVVSDTSQRETGSGSLPGPTESPSCESGSLAGGAAALVSPTPTPPATPTSPSSPPPAPSPASPHPVVSMAPVPTAPAPTPLDEWDACSAVTETAPWTSPRRGECCAAANRGSTGGSSKTRCWQAHCVRMTPRAMRQCRRRTHVRTTRPVG